MAPIQLSNDTFQLSFDPQLGCTMLSLRMRGPDGEWAPVLREGADGESSFLMLPWTNRVKDARFGFGGKDYTLVANHSDGTAIHGVGRDLAWGIADRSPFSARCVLDSRLHESVDWPFAFGAVFRVEIGADWAEFELDLTNLGEEAMPCGVGHHPYFMRTLFDARDELRVRAGVSGRYPCADQIPTGASVDDAVSKGLREGGPIGNPNLDDVFGGFDGKAELGWDASGVRCVMECSDAFGHLVVYAPRDESKAGTPPLPWVCVEPVTMVNDAFNSSETAEQSGLRVLEAGETLRTTMRLSFRRD
tara:strand:+ start:79360 stop:80271 length:912 start_codon:yes stop_codon:yes gene_type:complete